MSTCGPSSSASIRWCAGSTWREQPGDAQRQGFKVAVIGAGMGGAGWPRVQLKRAGVPVRADREECRGGRHLAREPLSGRAGRFAQSHLFQRVRHPVSNASASFCLQEVQERYFNWVTDHFGIREDIVFNTEVKSMIWDEASQRWDIGRGRPRWRARLAGQCGDHRGRLSGAPERRRDPRCRELRRAEHSTPRAGPGSRSLRQARGVSFEGPETTRAGPRISISPASGLR